jgi:Trypsin
MPILKRRAVIAATSLLSAVIFALAPTGVSAASANPAHATSQPRHPLPSAELVTEGTLGSTPDKIEQIGDTGLSNVFGALLVTRNRTHINVYLTRLTPATEAPFLAAAPRGSLTFLTASHTRLHLLAVHSEVTRDFKALATRGIHLVSWFPGVLGDTMEHIGVLNLTRAHARVLKRRFGAGNVLLQNVPPDDVPTANGTGRDSDSTPWNGGDNVASHTYGCTNGPGINYNGTQYMLTAAHCFEPGWDIYNAFPGDSGTKMGSEYSRDTTNNGDDTALLSITPSDLIWTGGYNKPVREVDYGSATNPDGDAVCNEGAYSGEVCSTVLNESYGCISVTLVGMSGSLMKCHIDEAEAAGTANDIATEDGDSGAPMIRYLSGELNVTGIVSSGSYQVPCQFNVQSTCYQVVYYTGMREILATEYPGATLVTG